MLTALLSGAVLAVLGITTTLTGIAVVTAVLLVLLFLMVGQYEILAVAIVVVNLLIDWYQLVDATQLLRLPLHVVIVSTLMALSLIGVMYFRRSPGRSWTSVPYLPLWVLLLLLAVYPLVHGHTAVGSIKYYITSFVNAVLMYTIGIQIGGDVDRVRRLLAMLAGFGAAVALHTVLYVKTGIFFLATHVLNDYLRTKGDFALAGSSVSRAGSFLYNPDINGAFLALMVLLPLGLLAGSRSHWMKLVYLGETALILIALLFTYSTASWIAVAAGVAIFIVFVSRGHNRLILLGMVCAVGASMVMALPTELQSFARHWSNPNELQLREGGWLTAVRVTLAYPITGIGLDVSAYEEIAAPYRVPQEYVPLGHPHQAYLELAALAGLPVLTVFCAIVGTGLRLALRNYWAAPGPYRGIVGGALTALIVLSINSLAINGWTLAPVVVVAWLILGAVASPAWSKAPSSATAAEAAEPAAGHEGRAARLGALRA